MDIVQATALRNIHLFGEKIVKSKMLLWPVLFVIVRKVVDRLISIVTLVTVVNKIILLTKVNKDC